MRFPSISDAALLNAALYALVANAAEYQPRHIETIYKDVLVVGAGASGTYAAIKLIDSNKTVAVVEREATAGGHVNTYTDPFTGTKVNFGVIVYYNIQIVKDFFTRLNVSGSPLNFSVSSGSVSKNIDFRTGKEVTDYITQDPTLAFQKYATELQKYPFLETGYEFPSPVPEDLLLPFGDFLIKHNMTDIMQTVFHSYAQGVGNVLDQTTLYVLKNVNAEVVRSMEIGFYTTTNFDNSEIYSSAASELLASNSLFLSSTALIKRTDVATGGITAIVSTPTGPKKIIANQLVISTPPRADLLNYLDISESERAVFQQFNNSAYYTGLIRKTGIPSTVSLQNARSDTLYNIPRLPALYSLRPHVGDLFDVKFGGPAELSLEEVKVSVESAIRKIGEQGTVAGVNATGEIEWVELNSHSPFSLSVSPDAIRKGFYKDLYALQGKSNTWWTGATWHAQDSSLLWNFTSTLVDRMLAA